MIDSFHIIAFTHRNLDVSDVGFLHIDHGNQIDSFKKLKSDFNLDEVLFISTCNRVEIYFVTPQNVSTHLIRQILQSIYKQLSPEKISFYLDKMEWYSGSAAIKHILTVVSSIDSMVIGEREIISQVRNAYNLFSKNYLTGDFLRLAITHAIQTGKKVYSQTNIATRQVSVVSLAFQKLKNQNLPLNARILVIGSGSTNTTFLRRMKKHGFSNFTIYNRTESNAIKLANEIGCLSHHLTDLKNHKTGFDLILTCTASEDYIVNEELYNSLLNGERDKKTIVDLAIPQDISPVVIENSPINYVSIQELQKESNNNLEERSSDIKSVNNIIQKSELSFIDVLRERHVEIAMREVPLKIKEIKSTAMNEVFRGDIDSLDHEAKLVLDKVLGYMEKKYISEPMKLAKEIILKNA